MVLIKRLKSKMLTIIFNEILKLNKQNLSSKYKLLKKKQKESSSQLDIALKRIEQFKTGRH